MSRFEESDSSNEDARSTSNFNMYFIDDFYALQLFSQSLLFITVVLQTKDFGAITAIAI